MRTLALMAVFAAAALAQAPPFSAPPPPDGPKQAVSGRVVNAETGQPVRGAKVALMAGRSEVASSYCDSEGRFHMDEAPVGDWMVSIVKSGYAGIAERVSVPAAQPLTGVELRIHRNAVITGRVLDHLDRPVVGAQLVALTPRLEEGGINLRPAGRGMFASRTDDRGEYRIWNLTPGPHIVGVFPKGAPAPSGVMRFESSGAFYPNVSSLEEAERIQLDWGQVREGVDLRLDPPAETRTLIQAVLPNGKEECETCSLQVMLDGGDSTIPISGMQLGPGGVSILERLAPGRYWAALRGFERSTSSMWHGVTAFEVSAQAQRDPVVVVASGEVPVRGRVVLEERPADRQGAPFQTGLQATPPRERMQLGAMTRGRFANLRIEGAEAPFELSYFPGEIELQLMSRDESYIAGVSLNGQPLESPTITIPPGGIPEGLVVRIRFDSGVVEGKLDSPPAPAGPALGPPEYAAFARPADPERSFTRGRFLSVMPDGAFQQRLPPGAYELVAFPVGRRVMPPEEELRKLARRVEVKAGETTNVTLPTPKQP